MSLLTKLAPTSASVQKEYLQKRKRALFANDDAKTERVKKKIQTLQRKYGIDPDQHDWLELYKDITAKLQRAELTINLDAASWFAKANHYKTYATMYERGVGADGKMALQADAQGKDASVRAVVDDLITLPDEWANAHCFSQRRRLYDALTVSGARATRETLQSLSSPAPESRPLLKGTKDSGFKSVNKSLKPKAKQVFAALNYGGRPHGSCTFYGWSYIQLKPALKRSALYYAGDTYFSAARGAAQQATFETLGALVEYADPLHLMPALWDSLVRRERQDDTALGELLVEAHIFRSLRMAEDVQTLFLSRQRSKDKAPLSNPEWETIKVNADVWCTRNSVKLMLIV